MASALGSWAAPDEPVQKPVLLVFMLGGASLAELRCAREAAEQAPDWFVEPVTERRAQPRSLRSQVGFESRAQVDRT